MAQLFTFQGRQFVFPDNPTVVETDSIGGGAEFIVFVTPYVESVEVPADVPVSAAEPVAGAPAGVDDLTVYAEHNGDEPHVDPAMRCQCAACDRVMSQG